MTLKEKDDWEELTDLQRDIINLKLQHPDWTNKRVADRVDTNPSHVSRILNTYSHIKDSRMDVLDEFLAQADPNSGRGQEETEVQVGETSDRIDIGEGEDIWINLRLTDQTVLELLMSDALSRSAKRNILTAIIEQSK